MSNAYSIRECDPTNVRGQASLVHVFSVSEQSEEGASYSPPHDTMLMRSQAILIPLPLDNKVVAHLLLVHPTLFPHMKALHAPKVPDSLRAAILPWTVTPGQLELESRPDLATALNTDTAFDEGLSKHVDKHRLEVFHQSTRSHPFFQQAIRILEFPPEVYTYLTQTNRPWAVFSPPSTTTHRKKLLEEESMLAIMRRIKGEAESVGAPNRNKYPIAREAPSPETAQIIFIHVGAVKHLSSTKWLRDRVDSPDYVRFYTFGSHPSVPSRFWGVREIYPCGSFQSSSTLTKSANLNAGGVVTFLPSAFLLQPLDTLELIKKIHDHPFWTAYILPSVLGLVAELSAL